MDDSQFDEFHIQFYADRVFVKQDVGVLGRAYTDYKEVFLFPSNIGEYCRNNGCDFVDMFVRICNHESLHCACGYEVPENIIRSLNEDPSFEEGCAARLKANGQI
jgi:hypothetical protein